MILLDVKGIRKHFGPEPVLDGATFEVRPGEGVGLVGPNGCGKSTLMKILARREEADEGTCELHGSAHLGYLEQQASFDPQVSVYNEAKAALAGLISLEREAVEVSHEMSATDDPAERERLSKRFDHLQHELHTRDAYNIEHKIERVLDGLGFRREAFTQPAASLSGGEQNRLLLAKLLLAEPNLMLLDEPSNHLDIEATEWLEKFLIESSAAYVVVSHDRYFLDRTTNRTLELFHGTIDSYVGNFTAYWTQKQERLLVHSRTYEKQCEEIEKTKDFIRRNHYGQKSAQAEDRRKKLVRLEEDLVAPPKAIAAPPMHFPPAARSGDIVLRVEGLGKAYDRQLFNDLTADVIRGERWGLLGPNGSGKSTLLKCLLGEQEADAGRVIVGQGVEIGYFDQHLSSLPDDAEVADAVRPKRNNLITQQRRDLLAKFGVTGDTALQKVGSLSGGERCRVALAKLSAENANFLILDEPTNHLDLWARDSLEKALTGFDGTVMFVSHDRYFLNKVADHLIILEPNGVRVIEGNYDAYRLYLEMKANGTLGTAKTAPGEKPSARKSQVKKAGKRNQADEANEDPKADASTEAPKKKRKYPFRKVSDIEDEIFMRETSVSSLEEDMTNPEILRNGERVRELVAQIAEEKELLQKLYEHWEEATQFNW